MKNFLSIVLFLFLFSACTSYKDYVAVTTPEKPKYALPSHFLDIPLPSHNRKIDMLVPGETIPDSMVLPVRLVEARAVGGNLEQSLDALANKAQNQGLDGVVLTDRYLTSVSDSAGEVYVASGIGYIYEHRLNLLNLRVKAKTYTRWNGLFWEHMGKVHYSKKGGRDSLTIKPKHSQDFTWLVAPYDLELLHHSIAHEEGWKEKKVDWLNEHKHSLIKSVHTTENDGSLGVISQTMELLYRNKRLVTVDREYTNYHQKNPSGKKMKEQIQIRHKSNQIDLVDVKSNGKNHHYQQYHYDDLGRLKEIVWYSWLMSGAEFPYIRVTCEYYEPKDYRPALRFAPDIPMRASLDLNKRN
jgi:hypothetical protein